MAIRIQMGHCLRPTDRQLGKNGVFYIHFYSYKVKQDKCLHILWFLHFTDNRNEADRTDENFDRLWNIRNLSYILNRTFSNFYNCSTQLAVDEVTNLFKVKVTFEQSPQETEISQHKNIKNYVTPVDI
jgi:hypothetical protein